MAAQIGYRIASGIQFIENSIVTYIRDVPLEEKVHQVVLTTLSALISVATTFIAKTYDPIAFAAIPINPFLLIGPFSVIALALQAIASGAEHRAASLKGRVGVK